jgi:beta-glucosidase
MSKKIFPKNFYWGASTASHQVEGGNHNQWTVWELANATKHAKDAQKLLGNLPNWSEIKSDATNPENYVSGKGVDHYRRYQEDFDILKSLNMNSFRFGIEWSRVEPSEGEWNQDAIEHYRSYIQALRDRGVEPFLNIWHWTSPVWFEKRGGFKKRDNVKAFCRFVQKLSDEYGSDLTYVITLNEPNWFTTAGYILGVHPPQERNFITAGLVYWNLCVAHKQAYKILKRDHPHLQIGVASQLANIQAKRPHSFVDEVVTKFMRYSWNWWFLRRIRKYQDFVGINYYFTDYYRGGKRDNPSVPLNDRGWYMEPEGIYPLLLRTWSHFKKPIFITENGLADQHDQHRRWWLEETIIAMERALSEGVDLRGYFYWSLLDNFEWEVGWWPKFGLVEVDREHGMKRIVRPSARWLAGFIQKLR